MLNERLESNRRRLTLTRFKNAISKSLMSKIGSKRRTRGKYKRWNS